MCRHVKTFKIMNGGSIESNNKRKDMYKTKLSHDKIIMSEEIKARSKILNYHLF